MRTLFALDQLRWVWKSALSEIGSSPAAEDEDPDHDEGQGQRAEGADTAQRRSTGAHPRPRSSSLTEARPALRDILSVPSRAADVAFLSLRAKSSTYEVGICQSRRPFQIATGPLKPREKTIPFGGPEGPVGGAGRSARPTGTAKITPRVLVILRARMVVALRLSRSGGDRESLRPSPQPVRGNVWCEIADRLSCSTPRPIETVGPRRVERLITRRHARERAI